MPTLGRFIRRRRLELGMTQEQMAGLVGDWIRQSEISRLENDRVTLPRRERLERIAEVLQVPIGELLVRSGWIGADIALATVDSPPLPVALPPKALPIVLELIDEVKGLLDEIQAILREEELARTAAVDGDTTGTIAAG